MAAGQEGDKLMRIGLVVPYLEVGGVETFVFRLAGILGRAGHLVEIVATEREGAWFGRARELGFDAVCLERSPGTTPSSHAMTVGRYLAKRRFDVCLLNHARFAQAALGLLPDNTAAVPVIHNDWEHVYEIGCGNARAWNLGVAVSQKTFQTSAARAPGKPMTLIPYGVDMPPPERLRHRRFDEPRLRIVYAGRLHHAQKGVLLLPQILAECRRRGLIVQLNIIGEGPDRALLEERAIQENVQTMISFQGSLPPTGVISELSEAHVLLLPSFYEGLPIVLLEAMGCGCVPITSRLEGITDFAVSDGQSGRLVETGNISAFADALEGLALNRGSLRDQSALARECAEKRFSLAAMADAYGSLFDAVRGGRYPLNVPRAKLAAVDSSLFDAPLPQALWRRLWRKLSRLARPARGLVPPSVAVVLHDAASFGHF